MKYFASILLVCLILTSACKHEEVVVPIISVERIPCLKQSIVVPGQRNILLYELKITSLIEINVSEIEVAVQSGNSFKNNVTLLLVINDIARDMEMYYKNSVSFSLDDINITPSQDCRVKIFVDIDNGVTPGETISLTLQKLQAIDTSGRIITPYDKPLGEVVTVR